MAIKTVQAIINGQAYTLTFNSGTGKYEATITAPGKTSFNQPGGYYNVQVKATNEAGSVGTADASTMAGLKLVVRERVTPVITIISPSTGVKTGRPPSSIFMFARWKSFTLQNSHSYAMSACSRLMIGQ